MSFELDEIFKTPENEINFKSFIRFSLFLLRFICFNFYPNKGRISSKDKLINFAKFVVFSICVLSYGLAVASFVAFFVVNSDKFRNSICISHAMTSFLVGFKVLINYLHKNDLLEIFEELTEISRSRQHCVKQYLDGYHRVVKIYAIFFVTITIPTILDIIPYLKNGTMALTVMYWYPFNPYRVEFFPLAWFWQNWVAWAVCFGLLGTDSLLYGLITCIVMEFDVLEKNLLNLTNSKDIERRLKIRELIERHKKLLQISGKLQNIYALTFFFVFLISSTILCLAVFQMTTTKDIYIFWFDLSYMGTLGGQVLLVCYFGQKLIDSSKSISNGIYKSGWELSDDVIYKKNIILIMMRAQRITRLTALKFADVSLESFTSVISH